MSDDAQAIIDSAIRSATPSMLPGGGQVLSLVLPTDGSLHVIDTEQYDETPRRKRGTVRMFTADSLAEYVNGHKGNGTALYADLENVTIVGVLNGHVPVGLDVADEPGWGDHRAVFSARLTNEWKAWKGIDGKFQEQRAFAEFIEDHIADISAPPAADLLELAKTFEAKTNVDFKSGIRLDDGTQQLTYIETIVAAAGQQKQIVIPERIDLGIAPFEGAAQYRLGARFRYRINAGALHLGVVLDRPDLVLKDAFEAVLGAVENTTEVLAYRGTPAGRGAADE